MQQQTPEWLTLFIAVHGTKGVIALAWWLGARHAVEIRELEGSFPLLQVVQTGPEPSSVLDALSALSGAPETTVISAATYSRTALNRTLFADTDLPLVIDEPENQEAATFDWDELKPLFNNCTRRAVSRVEDPMRDDQKFSRALVLLRQEAFSPALQQRTVQLQVAPAERVNCWWPAIAEQRLQQLGRHTDALALSPTARRQLVYRIGGTQAHIEAMLDEVGRGLSHRTARNHAQLIALVYTLTDVFGLPEDVCGRAIRDIHDMAYEKTDIPF